jgi:hypothetical protein
VKTETKDGESKDKKNDLAGMFKRMPSEALTKIRDLADTELERRNGKDVKGMSQKDFDAYVAAQFDKAAKAAREGDLRRQLLGGKSKGDQKEKNSDE